MLKEFLHNLKYSALIRTPLKILNDLTSDYFEKEWITKSYEDRKISNLYPYGDKRPWDITITRNFQSLLNNNDHEHIILSFQVFASDRNEVKEIIESISISAQDMSKFEGYPCKKYCSMEEYSAAYEVYKENIKVIIVP